MRAYRVAYDGKPYHGFQRQPDVRTVEGRLLDALAALDVTDGGETPEGYAAAGRTDAGVSAVAQTVAFEAPSWLLPAAFNSELPPEIRVWASAPAPTGFHATHDATERTYRYHLHAPAADDQRVAAALDRLAGTHDFHNLARVETGTRRTIDTTVERDGSYLVITVSAGGFPREFVRRLVSLVAGVGRGDGLDRVDRALDAEPLQGPAGIAPAPPEPLVLRRVSYPELTFAIDETASRRAHALFDQQRADRRTAARVSGEIADILSVSGAVETGEDR